MWHLTFRVEYFRKRSADPEENSYQRSLSLGIADLGRREEARAVALEKLREEKYKDPTFHKPQLVWIENL
jgi:hypothetical protein